MKGPFVGRTVAAALVVLPAVLATAAWGAFFRLRPDNDRAAIRQVLAVQQRWVDSVNARDAHGLDRILAEGYVASSSQAEVLSKAAYIALIINAPPGFMVSVSDFTVTTYRDAAVVAGHLDIHTQFGTRSQRYTDAYVRRGGSWYFIGSQSTALP